MSFTDIAYLLVYQVEGGRLQYRRRKTKWSKSANMVRDAVAQYTKEKARSVLENKITLNDSGQKQSVIDFLSRI